MSPPPGVLGTILPNIDTVLGVRDSVGAVIQPVYFVTRTWAAGTQPGEGTPADVLVQMLPSPGIKNLSQNIQVREGGAIKAGDIILTNVSRNSFTEAQLDGTSSSGNIEKLYLVGAKLYQVISVVEKYVTWDVQLRELTNQTRY